MDDLLAEFLAETVESVERVDRLAGRGRLGGTSEDAAGAVFRMTTSIGATAKFLEIPRLEAIAGAAEGLAGKVRGGDIVSTPAMADLLLAAVRRIEEISRTMLRTGTEPCGGDDDLVDRLENAVAEVTQSRQINALDNSLRPNMGAELSAESPPPLRVIVGGGSQEGARDETLPDRR